MWNRFKSTPNTPGWVPSDDVIPLHHFDDNPILRKIVVNFMLKFDDVLDPERLREALERVVTREDGWRKLTARLRLNEHGKLEYHVPKQCSAARPALVFSYVNYDMPTTEHPIAIHFPKSTTSPSVVADPNELHPLTRPTDGPKELADYLYTDLPQLGLHVVSFHDATLVSLTWPHTLIDGSGQKEIFQAWSLALQGRDDEIRPLGGVENDPLGKFGLQPQEVYKHADRLVTGRSLLTMGLRVAWDSLWRGEEARVICMPVSYVKALQDTAIRDLKASGIPNDKKHGFFVSEGDVLCAWLARLALGNQPGKKSVSIMNAIDIRSILGGPGDLLPADRAYVSNAVLALYALLSRDEVLSQSLGHLAAAIRESVTKLGTREQAEAYAGMARQSQIDTGYPPVFGDAWTQGLVFSNWTKINYFEPDFSAAIVGAAKEGRTGAKSSGKPTYIQMSGFYKGMPLRNTFSIMGKDADGTYWLNAVFPKGVWSRITANGEGTLNGLFVIPDVRAKL
ncbi:hypothetical protein CcaCcLH18_04710 [Colletotrichum camelliae]|nr:hypothetical protein CcaCcLH18_04710 [Colletotrichum camelliae]